MRVLLHVCITLYAMCVFLHACITPKAMHVSVLICFDAVLLTCLLAPETAGELRDRHGSSDYISKTFVIVHLKICTTSICPICPGSSVLCPFKIQCFNRSVHPFYQREQEVHLNAVANTAAGAFWGWCRKQTLSPVPFSPHAVVNHPVPTDPTSLSCKLWVRAAEACLLIIPPRPLW